MHAISAGLNLVWKAAAKLAIYLKHKYIEREHLIIAIYSFEEILRKGKAKLGISDRDWESTMVEKSFLSNMIYSTQLCPEKIKEILFENLTPGDFVHKEPRVHRSENCRHYFEEASKIGRQLEARKTNCLHLLFAITRNPGPLIKKALEESGKSPLSLDRLIEDIKLPMLTIEEAFDQRQLIFHLDDNYISRYLG